MANLSLRGLDPATLAQLKTMAEKEGASVNALILRLIDQSLGKVPAKRKRRRYDDLDALAGAWNAPEAADFEAAVAPFSEVDPELWK